MLFIVDVESDGPCPGLFSMISFGAVAVDRSLSKTFLGQVAPLPGAGRLEAAAAISGTSRAIHETYLSPEVVMENFRVWIKETNKDGHPVFVSDNPAFDWQFINYYFHKYQGSNPFGFSARRIGDFYSGLTKNFHSKWKHLRGSVPHDHNPVNDALGNATALISMADQYKIRFKVVSPYATLY